MTKHYTRININIFYHENNNNLCQTSTNIFFVKFENQKINWSYILKANFLVLPIVIVDCRVRTNGN